MFVYWVPLKHSDFDPASGGPRRGHWSANPHGVNVFMFMVCVYHYLLFIIIIIVIIISCPRFFFINVGLIIKTIIGYVFLLSLVFIKTPLWSCRVFMYVCMYVYVCTDTHVRECMYV